MQFLYKQNLKQYNFIHLFCEACNGAKQSLLHPIDDRRKQVFKWALITSGIQKCPFHCCYADKMSCNINKAKQNEETNFQFGAHELRSAPVVLALKRC